MDQARTIARVELYERVWTTPMQRLANEFGLSDVGLAKLCRRHQIPVPGRGYWTRLQFGQKPGRTPLPKNSNLAIENITMVLQERRPSKPAALKPDPPVSRNRGFREPPDHTPTRSANRQIYPEGQKGRTWSASCKAEPGIASPCFLGISPAGIASLGRALRCTR